MTVGKTNDSDEMELELEREKELEKEMEKEMEKELEMQVTEDSLNAIDYQDLINHRLSSMLFKLIDRIDFSKIDDIEALVPKNSLANMFKQDTYTIKVSPNLMLSQRAKADFIGSSAHAGYRLSNSYLLVCKKIPPEKDVYVLISNEDAAKIKSSLLATSDSKELILVSFADSTYAKIPSAVQFDTKDENFLRVVVQAKLLNGNLNFSKEELSIIENDIIGKCTDKQEAAKELKAMFENLISNMESSLKRYNISPLRKLFKRLCM